ncbi:MAG TPA: hypothetical protein VEK14_05255, partial [Rhodomicrobium sp.]|nr:hypothetical protein [Rhodomicrobium sp.]
PVDWTALFTSAGLDRFQFKDATPEWTSLAASDTRAAWTGVWPVSGRPLRIEAAAFRGRPVFFRLIGPWTRPERMSPFEDMPHRKVSQILQLVFLALIFSGAAALARRNYKRGHSDRRGAFRLAQFLFVIQLALWLAYGHFVPDVQLTALFVFALSFALFMSALSWLLYMALEPLIRKLWPQTIISWTRVVSGRIRDPLVARDTLFGIILGLIWVLILGVRFTYGFSRLGLAPQMLSTDYLLGLRSTLGALLVQLPDGIQGTLAFFFILAVLRFLLRKPWAAAVGFVVIFTTLRGLASHHPALEVPASILVYGIAAVALVRFGLVTLAVAVFVADTLLNVPVTFDFSRWYAPFTLAVPLVFLALAIWSFRTALAGQKLIKPDLMT